IYFLFHGYENLTIFFYGSRLPLSYHRLGTSSQRQISPGQQIVAPGEYHTAAALVQTGRHITWESQRDAVGSMKPSVLHMAPDGSL
ncbi:MAG: hypothetical protein ACLRVT_03265, partial [Oscillospiraceae bacterium]